MRGHERLFVSILEEGQARGPVFAGLLIFLRLILHLLCLLARAVGFNLSCCVCRRGFFLFLFNPPPTLEFHIWFDFCRSIKWGKYQRPLRQAEKSAVCAYCVLMTRAAAAVVGRLDLGTRGRPEPRAIFHPPPEL